MNRSAIQNTLATLQTRPTKSLGQNFLHDEEVASWIVDQLRLCPEDHLVEVGPGLGALSEYAQGRCRSATLIEKDGRLADFLRERFSAAQGWEVLHQDALEYDLRALFPRGGVKVLEWFETEITDASGDTVARVRREVYIREKQRVTNAAA